MDVVFCENAGGSLKLAQHYGEGPYRPGAVSVICSRADGRAPTAEEIAAAQRAAGERKRRAWEEARPLGGSHGDVFVFPLALSAGCLSDGACGPARQAVLAALSADDPDRATQCLRQAEEALERLHRRAAAGEPLRIWYSDQPDEACGLVWLLGQLEAWGLSDTPVRLIRLPCGELEGDRWVVYRGWGEMEPGRWHRYLPFQREAPHALRLACAQRWRELCRENALLRAVVNGRLQSVPADFYDHLLRREIAAEHGPFSMAALIARVLHRECGVGDGWLCLRLEGMLASGELRACSEPPADGPRYHRMLEATEVFRPLTR